MKALVGGVVVLLGALVWRLTRDSGERRGTPFTLSEITHSETAARFNVDNRPPAALLDRVGRLCIVAGHMRAIGLRVTSGYRTQWVNGLVTSGASDYSPDIEPVGGDHPAALGLDVGGDVPTVDVVKLQAVTDKIMGDAFLRSVVRAALVHGNHVHVSLDPEKLDALEVK